MTFSKQHQLNYAASTAPSSTSSTKGYNPNAPEWTAPDAQEYLPSSYNNGIPPVSIDLVFLSYPSQHCNTRLPIDPLTT